jgi:hypothetical protein
MASGELSVDWPAADRRNTEWLPVYGGEKIVLVGKRLMANLARTEAPCVFRTSRLLLRGSLFRVEYNHRTGHYALQDHQRRHVTPTDH